MYEDELPDMSDAEYDEWYAASQLIDGVRVGPRVASSAQTDNTTPTQGRADADVHSS